MLSYSIIGIANYQLPEKLETSLEFLTLGSPRDSCGSSSPATAADRLGFWFTGAPGFRGRLGWWQTSGWTVAVSRGTSGGIVHGRGGGGGWWGRSSSAGGGAGVMVGGSGGWEWGGFGFG